MEDFEQYAFVTVEHSAIGRIDIKVSREIPMKLLIDRLFTAVGADQSKINGYYIKALNAKVLLSPSDSLIRRCIYDGEILRIL